MNAQKEKTGSFSIERNEKVGMGYALYVPKETSSPKPLIVFLHGSGERGTDISLVSVHGPLQYLKTHEIDAYVLAPQCRENELWDNEALYGLILKIVKENKIDNNRIVLTGLSLGGWGTWRLGMAHPGMFAAVVPVCGFVDLMDTDDICKLKDVPVRMYHGLLDDVVNPDFAVTAYKILKACGGNVELTIFDDANHNSWDRVYENPETYKWMLAQTKTR